jgi:chorismate mutase / prephenate dehydratase
MPTPHVAYLGPEGTFSHLVARRRFGDDAVYHAVPSVRDVFDFVKASPNHLGIVPIENSSGGAILDTVDIFINDGGDVRVLDEVAVNIRLALLGPPGVKNPVAVYSHFAPLQHCRSWLREHFPGARHHAVSSTSEAARRAAEEGDAVALGNREAAPLHGLEVLHYPVASEIANVTHFFTIGHEALETGNKSTWVVKLVDAVGSLCSFLTPLKDSGINLSRIVSRPKIGEPNSYMFFIDVDCPDDPQRLQAAMAEAGTHCNELRCVGIYPVLPTYDS